MKRDKGDKMKSKIATEKITGTILFFALAASILMNVYQAYEIDDLIELKDRYREASLALSNVYTIDIQDDREAKAGQHFETIWTITYNSIDLPAIGDLDKLQYLILKNNKFTRLPDEIGDLEILKELDLTFNKITELPKTIRNLSKLSKLDMTHNQLKKVPNTMDSH